MAALALRHAQAVGPRMRVGSAEQGRQRRRDHLAIRVRKLAELDPNETLGEREKLEPHERRSGQSGRLQVGDLAVQWPRRVAWDVIIAITE